MSADYEFEASGEVIKMIHDELPAVRWTCGSCGEDTATIFEPDERARVIECEHCSASNLVEISRL